MKRKLMCTEIRMLRNGFNTDQVMKGNNCSWKLLFFCFSSSVHLQLSTMLTGGWNKEFDDLQYLHLFFVIFQPSRCEAKLYYKKVQNFACAFYFLISTIRINRIFLFRIWDNSSIFFCNKWPQNKRVYYVCEYILLCLKVKNF